jgi:hypothetical protein
VAIERTFCSDVSAQGGEPLLGSAPTCSELVLVSWPKGDWESDALETPGLPHNLVPWRDQRSGTSGRTVVRLASQPGTSSDALVAMGWPGAWRAESMQPRNLVTGMDAAIQAMTEGRDAAVMTRPVLVVCAHGNHDACCALHGTRVAQRARKAAARLGLELDVWESSHLGGHRFAATAITLPWGHMHGRLSPDDAETLVEMAAAGQPWLDRFRGNIFLDEPRQVAEGAAMRWAADNQVPGRVFVGPLREGAVAVSVGERQIVVRVEPRSYRTLKSCDEALHGPLEIARYVVEAIEEV